MKIAVYDRFWSTAGGGEKFAGGIASVLAADHDVSLVGHEALDLDDLGERLQLDLSGVEMRAISQRPGSVERSVVDDDLLINASYTSAATCTAARGIYVVHFPQEPAPPAGAADLLAEWLRPRILVPGVRVELGEGFHDEERVGRHRVRWTDGKAELAVFAPEGTEVPVTVVLARLQPRELEPIPYRVEVDGVEVAAGELRRTESRLDRTAVPVRFGVRGRGEQEPVAVRILSPSFSPAALQGVPDTRSLGVPVAGVGVGDRARAWVARWFPAAARPAGAPEWIRSYDRVVSNSAYTQRFVRRWWHTDDGVLNPPVTLQPRLAKEPLILSVGRFFDAASGHSKKQLEMVRAFRSLLERGLRGWELHLVGGCGEADRIYLERVSHAARDLPVVLHVGAPGAELRDLYGRASIYWHAAGLGEDPERHPDRFEHFGITTVEAMSAGAVPVVIGHAGQLEVLDHAVEGFHWRTPEDLVAHTELLIRDEALRQRFADAAQQRARRYGMDVFAQRVQALVEEVTAGVGAGL